MTTQERLISELRARFDGESEAGIARAAGLSPQRWNNYTKAHSRMDDDAVIGCANALGMDAGKTVAMHRAELARTNREKAFWRRVASAAAVAVVAILTTVTSGTSVATELGSRTHTMYLT